MRTEESGREKQEKKGMEKGWEETEVEGGWERMHEEMRKRGGIWGSAEGQPDLTGHISLALEEEEGEAGSPCGKAGLAAAHIPIQNTAAPAASPDQATIVPHDCLHGEGWCPPGCQQPHHPRDKTSQ